MGFKLKISVKARLDVQEAIDWYNNQLSELGIRFLNDFRSTIVFITENPYLFRKFDGNNREARLTIFPYLIIYKVEDLKITVLGVFNTHQNPTKKP